MSTTGRFIDGLPLPEKNTTIEVIVLGLSRTGTMSMYNALGKLGYKSYHMSECCMNASKGSLIAWSEAVEAKYGHSPSDSNKKDAQRPAQYGPSDFAKLLDGYTATTDVPTALFLPELMATYPDAKLVLTTHPRGVDAWLKSIRNSFYRVGNWSVFDYILMPYDELFARPYMTLIRRIVEIWTGGRPWSEARDFDQMEPRLRKTYEEHNATMRKLAAEQGRELLEFDPREGWAPLCKFLRKEVPAEKYPHVNEGEHVVNLHKWMVFVRLRDTFGKAAGVIIGSMVVAGAGWWWMRS